MYKNYLNISNLDLDLNLIKIFTIFLKCDNVISYLDFLKKEGYNITFYDYDRLEGYIFIKIYKDSIFATSKMYINDIYLMSLKSAEVVLYNEMFNLHQKYIEKINKGG